MAWIGVKFEPPLDRASATVLSMFPGVRLRNPGFASCPDHLFTLVQEAAARVGSTATPGWGGKSLGALEIERIPLLRKWVPGFLTHYQREGITHSLKKWAPSAQSGMFVWSAGCLSGDTRITINRGGKSFSIT